MRTSWHTQKRNIFSTPGERKKRDVECETKADVAGVISVVVVVVNGEEPKQRGSGREGWLYGAIQVKNHTAKKSS